MHFIIQYIINNAKFCYRQLIQIIINFMNRKKRQCQIITQSDLFYDFQRCNRKIYEKYKQTSHQIVQKGIAMLQRVAASYLNSKRLFNCSIPAISNISQQSNSSIPIFITKKGLIPQNLDNQQNTITFGMSNIKNNTHKRQSKQQSYFKQLEQIRKSLKKIHISDDEDDDSSSNLIPKDFQKQEQLSNLTLQQLIENSNKKAIQKQKQRQKNNIYQQQSSDSSYPLTDYDSNQSSNDNEYEEEFRDDFLSSQNIMNKINVSKQPQNNKFQMNKIMYSPKKDKKSYHKVLYIRNKKIPRWATNLDKVNEQVKRQQNSYNFSAKYIYGNCVAQKLDTNVIFNKQQIFYRGSSAKWNRNTPSHFQS